MRVRDRLAAAVSAAVSIGAVVALAGAGGADAGPAPITLGSTTGTPSMNVGSCAAGITCTFVPYDSVGAPSVRVPADGTITSFSENFPPAAITVELRVLRPASGGQFTGAGTSAPATSSGAGGVQTFSVNLPVKAGDVIGLNNSQSNLLFDSSDPMHPLVGYYIPTPLADGSSAVPDRVATGLRLPLSAVEQPSGTTTSTSTTTTVTKTVTPPRTAPVLTGVTQSAAKWRESGRGRRPPVGTTFRFRLNEPATVTIFFLSLGRRAVLRGKLVVHGRTGANRLQFNGRAIRLRPGSYLALFTARDAAQQWSPPPPELQFTILK